MDRSFLWSRYILKKMSSRLVLQFDVNDLSGVTEKNFNISFSVLIRLGRVLVEFPWCLQ